MTAYVSSVGKLQKKIKTKVLWTWDFDFSVVSKYIVNRSIWLIIQLFSNTVQKTGDAALRVYAGKRTGKLLSERNNS